MPSLVKKHERMGNVTTAEDKDIWQGTVQPIEGRHLETIQDLFEEGIGMIIRGTGHKTDSKEGVKTGSKEEEIKIDSKEGEEINLDPDHQMCELLKGRKATTTFDFDS